MQFNQISNATPDLTLGRLPSKVVHIFSKGLLLCIPDGKFRKVIAVGNEVGPTCLLCVHRAKHLWSAKAMVSNDLESIFVIFGSDCVYCGVDLRHPEITATKDHLIPRSKGGGNEPMNLVPSCLTCNGAKGDLKLEEFVAGDVEKFRNAIHRIDAGIQRYKQLVLEGAVMCAAPRPNVPTVHPGRMLKTHYLDPLKLSNRQLAELCGVSTSTISRITAGKGPITPKLALELERLFGIQAEHWLQMQNKYDLWAICFGADAEPDNFNTMSRQSYELAG